ncbi:hypothetical protein ACP4OV_013449 [Aristida adscensionis]
MPTTPHLPVPSSRTTAAWAQCYLLAKCYCYLLDSGCLPQPHLRRQVFVVSDLHTNYWENMEWVRRLPAEVHMRGYGGVDVLVVAGDVVETRGNFARTMVHGHAQGSLRGSLQHSREPRPPFFWEEPRPPFFWEEPRPPFFWEEPRPLAATRGRTLGMDSLEKLTTLVDACSELGVDTSPRMIGDLGIIPLYSWYHKSFDKEKDVNSVLVPSLEMPRYAEVWSGALLHQAVEAGQTLPTHPHWSLWGITHLALFLPAISSSMTTYVSLHLGGIKAASVTIYVYLACEFPIWLKYLVCPWCSFWTDNGLFSEELIAVVALFKQAECKSSSRRQSIMKFENPCEWQQGPLIFFQGSTAVAATFCSKDGTSFWTSSTSWACFPVPYRRASTGPRQFASAASASVLLVDLKAMLGLSRSAISPTINYRPCCPVACSYTKATLYICQAS